MEKITGINYNWYTTPENGEEFTNRTVGIRYGALAVECTEIKEHEVSGILFYDIHYSDGTIERVFNINAVHFTPTTPQKKG